MVKWNFLILMLFLSVSGYSQNTGLIIQENDCNSIVVNFIKGNKHGGSYILEKEIETDVWRNMNRENAKESRTTFSELPNGRYRVNMIRPSGKNIISNELSIFCSEEHKHTAGFHISPNPVVDKFSVCMKFEATSNYNAVISNYEGKEMMTQVIAEGRTEFEATRLETGLYFLSIYKDGKLFDTQKLIIQ